MELHANDSAVPPGREIFVERYQTLRVWLISVVPSARADARGRFVGSNASRKAGSDKTGQNRIEQLS
jgi:hypothetical protein